MRHRKIRTDIADTPTTPTQPHTDPAWQRQVQQIGDTTIGRKVTAVRGRYADRSITLVFDNQKEVRIK